MAEKVSSLRVVNCDAIPPGRARISHAKVANGLIYVSGLVARDPKTGAPVPGVAAQTRLILENIKLVVETAGSSMEHVMKTGCFLSDMGTFDEFNPVWESFFPRNPPARICVQAKLGPGFEVEIDAVAVMPEGVSTAK